VPPPKVGRSHERRDWSDRHGAQLIGQFLIDRDGIVGWVNIEGVAGLEKFPTDDELLAAAGRVLLSDQRG
jgi:hypothetical protein